MRATPLKGGDAGRYYVEHLPSYYLSAGEPPGRWFGRGAALSGLEGDVDGDEFTNLVAGLDPTGTVVRGRRYGDNSVRAYDLTFSAPKSVSVLWAVADPRIGAEVLAAHDTAVEAVLRFVEHHACTRAKVDGENVVVDAQGLAVARFRQHTSRVVDPQLHTHAVVIAKVQAPDGRWLALDGRLIECDQRTLSALYHATLRSELTSRLGVPWRTPVEGTAEMAGIDDRVLAGFSKRTTQFQRRAAEKLARFERTMGRAPTARERYRLEREAAVDSRPAKPTASTPAVLHARWRRELNELGVAPRRLVASVVARPRRGVLRQAGVSAMVDQALAALTEHQSTWRRNDLLRELARAVPTTLTVPADQLVGWLETVAEEVIARRFIEYAPRPQPGTPLRRDGRPVTESPLDRRFTAPAIVAEEHQIITSVERRLAAGGTPGKVHADGLDRGQRAVARAVAGSHEIVLVVGPAGAGKTTALRPAITVLRSEGRPVFGVAPSATAAAVLAAETGIRADTVDKLLYDHRTGRHAPAPAGTTVVVDEAGMLATARLAALLELADTHRWRVVLVGDPHQLSAVGRGGMFCHLTSSCPAVALEHAHRFVHKWERGASLALRAGRADALGAYHQYARLHDGPATLVEDGVVAAWDTARHRGSVAVLCASNETARRLNERLQAQRLAAGELTGPGVALPSGEVLRVGDVVATRRNDRRLTTDRGVMVKNRARWTIAAIHRDGTVHVAGTDGRAALP